MPYDYTKHPPTKWEHMPEKLAELIARAKAGEKNSSIALALGVTRDAVANKRAKLANAGRIEPIKSHWTAEEETRLVKMKSTGCRVDAIAKVLGKSIFAVQYKINCEGLGGVDLGEPCVWMKHCKEATAKLVALLCEHHPEHETRL
jgi:hypothetical protein